MLNTANIIKSLLKIRENCSKIIYGYPTNAIQNYPHTESETCFNCLL